MPRPFGIQGDRTPRLGERGQSLRQRRERLWLAVRGQAHDQEVYAGVAPDPRVRDRLVHAVLVTDVHRARDLADVAADVRAVRGEDALEVQPLVDAAAPER